MIWLVLGAACLMLLLGAAEGFARARVSTVKAMLFWLLALAGLALGTLLLLTGRGAAALWALAMLGPLAWNWWRGEAAGRDGPAGPQPRTQQERQDSRQRSGQQSDWQSRSGPRAGAGRMSREEAYQVLGLRPGATEAEIRAAYVRLMRAAHPDNGGSDWLATRINQARDALLGRR